MNIKRMFKNLVLVTVVSSMLSAVAFVPSMAACTSSQVIKSISCSQGCNKITGIAAPNSTVCFKVGNKTCKAKANSKGKFCVKVPKLKSGANLSFTANCNGSTCSGSTTVPSSGCTGSSCFK